MSRTVNRQWVVAQHPTDILKPHHFDYREAAIRQLDDGEVLLKTHAWNIAPVMRMYMMAGGAAGETPLEPGDVIHGRGIAEVVESRHAEYRVGEFVQAQTGWQTYKISTMSADERVRRLKPLGVPVHYALAVLGITGFSAYCGFFTRGEPTAADTVLISGAAGGVGSLVAQMARITGCKRIIGIAGSAEKAALVKALGCHECIDYHTEDVPVRIAALCPEGVDLYFDNVGGEILEATLDNLSSGARVVLCGSISEYQRSEPFGPRNYTRLRASEADMRGFFVYNHSADFDDAEAQLATWLQSGELKPVIDEIHGFENMPDALVGMFSGTSGGKRIVTASDDPVPVY